MTLGQHIRGLREQKQISLRELSRRLGITAAFLSDIELGRRYPSDQILSRIAMELAVEIENLRDYDARPPLDEIRRLSTLNPSYGIAFRKIVERQFSPDELLEIAKQKKPREKGK